MKFNAKTIILSIIATMLIGGAIGYFTINPFAYDGNSLEKQITIGINNIQNQNK